MIWFDYAWRETTESGNERKEDKCFSFLDCCVDKINAIGNVNVFSSFFVRFASSLHWKSPNDHVIFNLTVFFLGFFLSFHYFPLCRRLRSFWLPTLWWMRARGKVGSLFVRAHIAPVLHRIRWLTTGHWALYKSELSLSNWFSENCISAEAIAVDGQKPLSSSLVPFVLCMQCAVLFDGYLR